VAEPKVYFSEQIVGFAAIKEMVGLLLLGVRLFCEGQVHLLYQPCPIGGAFLKVHYIYNGSLTFY